MLSDGTGYPAYWELQSIERCILSVIDTFWFVGPYVSLGDTGSLPGSRLVHLTATILE